MAKKKQDSSVFLSSMRSLTGKRRERGAPGSLQPMAMQRHGDKRNAVEEQLSSRH